MQKPPKIAQEAARKRAVAAGLPFALQGADVVRALCILDKDRAFELQDRPLSILSRLHEHGLVKRHPFDEFANDRLWHVYETTLTDTGRAVAAALRS